MKNRLIWALMLTAGSCLLTGCATDEAATTESEEMNLEGSDGMADETAEVEVEEAPVEEEEAAEVELVVEEPPAHPWDPMAEQYGMTGEEMMAMMIEAATPGAEHGYLQHFVGEWRLESKMWMSPDSSEPETGTGTATVKPILGGRYFTEEVVMTSGGEEFQGFNLFGFDKGKQKYFFVWGDSWGTALLRGEGTGEGSGKVWTYYSEFDMPGMGLTEYKSVITVISPRAHVYEMFTKGEDGLYWQNMELLYTKR